MKVQNTHINQNVTDLHASLMQIVAIMNQPQRDEVLIDEAGIRLDRALFPLLVHIGRKGPIGVVSLADRVGRDYTTVSRQVAKLESLGLVRRQDGRADRRVREATITAKGRAMTDLVDRAREGLGRAIFQSWPTGEVDELVRLVGKFANALEHLPGGGAKE